jgi:hypothetical protein
MNELEKTLHRTRKTLWQVCDDLGLRDEADCVVTNLDNCSSCGIWLKHSSLTPDLDGNPICKECLTFYGK